MSERDELVRLIHRTVDRRIAATARPVETVRGTVAREVPGTRTVMVRIGGDSTEVPVTKPAMPFPTLEAGDEVTVDRRADGLLVIDKVLGRDGPGDLLRGAVDVKRDHDARGDRSSDDTSALMTAIAAGGTVIVPPGIYSIDPRSLLNFQVPSDTHIIGIGRPTIRLMDGVYPTDGTNFFTLDSWVTPGGRSNISFKGLILDGNWSNNVDYGAPVGGGNDDKGVHGINAAIYANRVDGLVIEDCEVKDFGAYGINLLDCSGRIVGNDVHDIRLTGIATRNGAEDASRDLVIAHNRVWTASVGIHVNAGSRRVTVGDNVTRDCKDANRFLIGYGGTYPNVYPGVTGTPASGFYDAAHGSYVSPANSGDGAGIELTTSYAEPDNTDVSIVGNVCQDSTAGIRCEARTYDVTITGNSCFDNDQYGIFLFETQRFTVTGNTCYNNVVAGVYVSRWGVDDAPPSHAPGVGTIVGNTLMANGQWGIFLGAASGIVVTGNLLAGNNSTAVAAGGGIGIYTITSGGNPYACSSITIDGNVLLDWNGNDNYGIYSDGTAHADIQIGKGNLFSGLNTADHNLPAVEVASAATMTLPTGEAGYYLVTGTTNITSITASRRGRVANLVFAGALTLTDGSNLKLAGNLATAADDTIMLVCDGTNWLELSRGATSGGTPGGAAGGDLSGTYPNPSVVDDSHAHTSSTVTPAGIGAAPSTVDYLVGTASGGLSAEIVVGTTPGGELGGTWASPTVDATHSGSAHHAQSHDHSAAGDGTALAPATLTIPSANYGTPGLTLGTANAAGAAATLIRSDATILAFDATAPAAVGTAAAGAATVAARRDHVHATGAGTPTTQAFGDAAATGSGPAAAMTDHKHAMMANPVTSGTWTPGLTFGGGATGMSITGAGIYVKSGRLVVASGYFTLTTKGSSTGAALLTGLPVACANDNGARGAMQVAYYDNLTSATGILGLCEANTTTAALRIPGAASTAAATDANFNSGASLFFDVRYMAAS